MSIERKCEGCEVVFEVPKTYPGKRFCSRACSNRHTSEQRAASTRAHGKYRPPICPCGKEVPPPPGQQYVYATQKKFCSDECRRTYGRKRQKDPTKWVTKVCQTCDKEFEFRTSSVNSGKFCSNACAAKHTKTVRHYVCRESDMVLDSTWEMLFAGLCGFLKVPCERTDRAEVVEWSPGHNYAPDFTMPSLGFDVEIKGIEDPDDPAKWAAWHEQRGPLLVLDREDLEGLRGVPSAPGCLAETLSNLLTIQSRGGRLVPQT